MARLKISISLEIFKILKIFNLLALREGDEDSNFSVSRVWRFSESSEPLD